MIRTAQQTYENKGSERQPRYVHTADGGRLLKTYVRPKRDGSFVAVDGRRVCAVCLELFTVEE